MSTFEDYMEIHTNVTFRDSVDLSYKQIKKPMKGSR